MKQRVMIAAMMALPALAGLALAQPPSRDRQQAASGTAGISGVVVGDDADARPLRRARVMVNSTDRRVGRTFVTDESGVFAFTDLPAGRYTLSATKDGSVTVTYGARRLGRPGTPIVLGEGQRIADVTLRVPRGAVVTGTLLDENGQPLPGAQVRVARAAVQNGERQFFVAGMTQYSDDRGMYRIYGLLPGEYIVVATAPLGQAPGAADIRQVTEEDVRRAMNAVRSPFASSQPGQPSPAAAVEPASAAPPTVAYAPVYYPGFLLSSQAGRVTLGVGEEKAGVDVQMQLVTTAKVEGTVVTPAGVPPVVTVNMLATSDVLIGGLGDHFRTTRSDTLGRFLFTGVMPGQYSLVTRGGAVQAARPGTPDGRTPPPPLWAQTDIFVDGRDMSDAVLSLQAGMTVSGAVRFAGERLAQPPDVSKARVMLVTVQSPGAVSLGVSPAQVDASGRFSITGVIPGRYRIGASIPAANPNEGWFLESAMLNGQDILDGPIDIRSGAPLGDLTLTFTDRASQLSGSVQDATGQPAPDHFIIAFTTDSALWMPQSRRIQSVRPSADGRYTIRNLPPGEYFLAAASDAEPGEWFDPAFLQQLVGSSIKVSIGQGEQKTQDLKLAIDRRQD